MTCMITTVIVPPERPRVYNERGEEVKVALGPYRVGERITVKCEVWGGELQFRIRCIPNTRSSGVIPPPPWPEVYK